MSTENNDFFEHKKKIHIKNKKLEHYIEEIDARAKTQNAALTPVRRAVLTLLFLHPQGLKAYELLEKIKEERSNAKPTTVYRALDFLMAQGFAHKIGRNNLFVACHHVSHYLPSLFLVCPKCRTVTELSAIPLMQMLKTEVGNAGFQLTSPEVEISALCPACA
ncbi:MAG: transcriptional repressor [Zoogloeaceae bacterium]|nr:transcriptional repressor [Zoogloeaceae bacterium]